MAELLRVNDLRTQFDTYEGLIKAVNGVSYHINEGEVVGLVGESGCGKSVSQLSVLQAVQTPGEIVGGEVYFEGRDILQLPANSREMRSIRGGKISMIFQEPMTALNPVLSIEQQMSEMLELHLGMGARAARERSIELLKMVGIPDAEYRIDGYPHQLSGGMRQRVMIAMAISCNPRLIIADEPTTAVDVTTQAQLLELMKDTVEQIDASLVIVTHNLGVIARYADRIYVMYAGRVVESGTLEEVFGHPLHPYTQGLLKCVPRLDIKREDLLETIPGNPLNLMELPDYCPYYPRCASRVESCTREEVPELKHYGGQQYAACHVLDRGEVNEAVGR